MQCCPFGTLSYVIQYGDTLWILAKRFNTTIEAIIMTNPGINLENTYVGQSICIPVSSEVSKVKRQSYERFNYAINLNNRIRTIWMEHVVWTRLVILGIILDMPDLDFSTAKLLKNPSDLAEVFENVYGYEKANQIKSLFYDHLAIAAEIVKTAKEGKNFQELERKWYENANDIAKYLSSINPYWSELEWRRMLDEHLQLTMQEAVYYLQKDYHNGVLIFDQIEAQALQMADMMTDGIIKQITKKNM